MFYDFIVCVIVKIKVCILLKLQNFTVCECLSYACKDRNKLRIARRSGRE